MAESDLAGYPDMASQVQDVVAAAVSEDSDNHLEEFKASISVSWEILQYIQEKLVQDPSLSRVLAVTAQGPSHAWALTCREYVEATWGGIGVLFLECLEEELMGCMLSIRFDAQGGREIPPAFLLDRVYPLTPDTLGRSCDFDLGSIEDEINGRPASATFWGTSTEIRALGEFVS